MDSTLCSRKNNGPLANTTSREQKLEESYNLRGKMERTNKPKHPTVEVVEPSYQPSKSELEADLRVDATFPQAVKALSKTLNIKHVKKPQAR